MAREPSWIEGAADLLLTTDPARRPLLWMWATSFMTYLLYSTVLVAQALIGFTDPVAAAGCIGLMFGVNAFFYCSIRCGWASGWTPDRNFGLTQLMVGIVFMWISYGLAGPASPATLVIMSSHIVYAMFTMAPKRVRMLVIFSLAGLAATMTISSRFDSSRYPADVQVISFCYAAIVLPLIARLANQVTSMSQRLRAQRRELSTALEQVRRLASRDDLTKAHNRRHMLELMRAELASMGTDRQTCIALIDIDFFKTINDRFGHAAGDDVLRQFAEAGQRVLRDTDVFARWGGEEFMAMFVDTSIAESTQVLDRLRMEMSAGNRGVPGASITFSAGLIEILPGEKLDAAIDRADQEMYRAKSKGRNQTCLSVAKTRGQDGGAQQIEDPVVAS